MPSFVKNDSRDIFGIDETKTKKVTVLPMTEEQVELCENSEVEKKLCFQNCYNIVMENPDRFDYILGVGDVGLLYEHAFIKDKETGTYFDPTGYMVLGHEEEDEMYVIKEFDVEALSEFVLKQEGDAYPPDFSMMSKMKVDMDKFITAEQFFRAKKEKELNNDGLDF